MALKIFVPVIAIRNRDKKASYYPRPKAVPA
jgi:hypothetical protein